MNNPSTSNDSFDSLLSVDEIKCRFCESIVTRSFADLGMTPLSNAFLTGEQLSHVEAFYPLHVRICDECNLVQLPELSNPEQIFSQYAYVSSYADSWIRHVENYAVKMIDCLDLSQDSNVIELASNDGCLLQCFKNRGVNVLGIDPAENIAVEANNQGIPTLAKFFGRRVAKELADTGQTADLVVANNVLAHVPDINDFVSGVPIILSANGVVTIEFPHLLKLVQFNQFDTIYHEHFSYLSLLFVKRLLERHGLTVYHVEEIWMHGGSLRIFAQRTDGLTQTIDNSVKRILRMEVEAGLDSAEVLSGFQDQVVNSKMDILEFFIDAKRKNKMVVGYGAPAKGNTLLNYCGIGKELLPFTVDRSIHKINQFLPGTHIPIFHPDVISEYQPDYLFLLSWNFKNEIMEQMDHIRPWGGKFVIPIPQLEILD